MSGLHHESSVDDLDRRLIEELRSDGRAPLSRLADMLGIAASTVHARLSRLLRTGVIQHFTVVVDPATLGYDTEALVSVRIRPGARSQLTAFAEQLKAHPQVAQYFYLAGAEDFVIHYRGRNRQDLRDFVTDHLSRQPIVAATNTSLVFEHESGPLRS